VTIGRTISISKFSRGGLAPFFLFFCLLFLSLSTTQAAITGQVEQIGFQNTYRPDCWTPMLVSIHPDSAAGNYFLQVVQEDLDRDRVVYQRPITLAGGNTEQRFWTCFIPQPSDGGLPDASEGIAGLQAKLKIYLADSAGKPVAQLPLTQPIIDIDPPYSHMNTQRAKRMILAVSDAGTGDVAPQYDYGNVFGVKEDVAVFSAAPSDLPDDCLGYESLDAIVLTNVDPAALKAANKFNALLQWVKEGGTLVICQNPQWQKMQGWGDLLPVTYPAFGGGTQIMQGSAERDDAGPIMKWASAPTPTTRPTEPFHVAVAQARPGADQVDAIIWPGADNTSVSTSYLVRRVHGVGTVTWIAIDLGEPALARANLAWPRVWQHIFGWNDDTLLISAGNSAKEQERNNYVGHLYAEAHGIDFGAALLTQMEHAGRSASLLLIAAGFLGIYWVLAGPGGYLFLLSRKRVRWSWFLFAGVVAVATLLTFLVVKIVLRGPPNVHHLSIVRTSPGEPAVVRSRIGLYIPRDNPAEPVSLGDTIGDSYITPYPIHPQQMKENAFAGYMQYTVNVRDATDETPPLIHVPFRSTLKKLQAKWLGPQAMIEGHSQLVLPEDGYINGVLTNGTGRSLQDVYFIFYYPQGTTSIGDWALYLPKWQIGDTIDLKSEFAKAAMLQEETQPYSIPGSDISVKARIASWKDYPKNLLDPSHKRDWDQWWFQGLSGGSAEADYATDRDAYTAFVILSLFDCLPTLPNRETIPRFEMQRRGARQINASNIVAAGALLVLARAEGPLLFPLEAGGQNVPGTGSVYYQMILPLDRDALAKQSVANPTATNPTTPNSTTVP
jgi:hypothetical protein